MIVNNMIINIKGSETFQRKSLCWLFAQHSQKYKSDRIFISDSLQKKFADVLQLAHVRQLLLQELLHTLAHAHGHHLQIAAGHKNKRS